MAKQPTRSQRFVSPGSFLLGACCAALIAVAVGLRPKADSLADFGAQTNRSGARTSATITGLEDFVGADPGQLQGIDVALMNLLCAQGLPGAENLEISTCLSTLDEWAKRVAAETARYLYQFKQHPEEFENSEGFFRMMMLVTVLQQDFKVHYHQERIDDPDFTKSTDLFILGLLGNDRAGTCASMPVLYVALGRRLGYPLSLVLTKEHVFVRWEDSRERFNVEATTQGITSFPDEYYSTWPHPVAAAEIERFGYLKSLTPQEELALFLSSRGDCLEANGRLADAEVAYALAHRMAPQSLNVLAALRTAVQDECQSLAGVAIGLPRSRSLHSASSPDRIAAEVDRVNDVNHRRWADQLRLPSP